MESGSVSKQQEAPLPVPVQGGYLLVAPENIVYCKAAGNYTHIFLSDGKELTLCKRLKELAAMLQGPKFYRTHQSYLVNLAHVVMWARENGNQLRLATGAAAPVARLRVKGLKNKLNMC